jgi:hypothetical protein
MKFLQRKSTKHSRRVAVAGDASATATGVVGASQEEDDNLLEGLNSEGDADNDYDDEMEEPEEEESPANGPVAGATAAVDTAGARSVKKLHAWVQALNGLSAESKDTMVRVIFGTKTTTPEEQALAQGWAHS